MSKTGKIRVGIGGWVFPPWRGTFYPKGLKQAEELGYAGRHVTAIEINGTFYGLQKPASYRRWHDETPDDFVFSLKGPRFVTHRKELGTAGDSIARFFDSGVAELGEKLGPILWQFAPFLHFDEGNFAAFLDLLPKHVGNRKLRHVLEVRHRSFADPAFIRMMQQHEAAIAQVEDEKYPEFDAITADFVYVRLRRCSEDEPTGYAPQALTAIAERFQAHAKTGRDCFVYFINGAKVRAPHAAMALIERLSE
ncbi:MAG TPA: DUF72 domain-containing protein [Stellaceae bacterium]|nr:DUF72 domain-containing protein [Stellaceae bacterium]